MRLKFALPGAMVLLLMGTAKGQNLNNPNKPGPLGTQVNTLTGNLFLPRNDIYLSGRGIDMVFDFYYNSYNHNVDEGFGLGWSFMYNIRHKSDTVPGKRIFSWGDGRQDRYDSISPTTFKSPRGFFTKLVQYQPGKFRLTEKDSSTWYFDNPAHGKVTSVQEPNGNLLVFNYADTLLASIVNSAGQSITLTYDVTQHLATLVDAIASPTRTYSYVYDAGGHLIEVRDPSGGKFKYTYLVNGPMKTAEDRNTNKIDLIYFPDMSVREVIGCNRRLSFTYDTATMKTVVTDHFDNGGSNQTTVYTYKKLDNLAWIVSMKGNCCGFNMEYEYDDNGNVIKMKDANGNSSNFTYDAQGNMLTATDPMGNTHMYTYLPGFNLVSSYKDPKGNQYTLEYDAKGNLTKLTRPDNGVFTATYNSQGDILTSTDPKGNLFNYSYDALGNPLTVTGPGGRQMTLSYDPRGNLVAYTDARGNTSTAEYDILDRMKRITDPMNQVVQLTYDANGNIVSYRNENDEVSQYSYDASDRIVKATDAKGFAHVYGYDAMNKVTSARSPVNAELTMQYDKRSRVNAIKDPEGNVTSVNYDANGNVVSLSFPNGQVIQYLYDALNRITKVKDGSGDAASFTYDANGNITSFINATGAITTATYDSLNRVRTITDPLGNSTTMTYDRNDNVVSIRDREGHTRFYSYDSLNRPVTFTDNNGFVIAVGYDPEGNVTSLTDQKNNVTTYTYDSLNRRKRMTYPNGTYTEFTYDRKGNKIANRLTDGTVISYQYDTLNRMIAKTLPGGEIFNYTYDASGNVLSATNSAGTVQFTYDNLSRVKTETFDGKTVRYDYSITGRVQSVTYPDNTKIIKEFDSRNQLVRILKDSVPVVSYSYNNAGQLVKTSYANGIETNRQYDLANRLSALFTTDGALQNSTFSYDRENNKTAAIRNNAPEFSEEFTYDDNYRLTQYKKGIPANPPVDQHSYNYDAAGNRLSIDLNGTATSYVVNNLNQVISANGGQSTTYTYNDRGNLVFDGEVFKSYDAEGRLTRDSISPSAVINYQYDAFNRRVARTVNGNTVKYTYSGASAIEEGDIAGNVTRQTVFTDFLTPVLSEANGTSQFYHQNEMKSVEAVTNENGRLVEKYRYDPYGETTIFDSLGNSLPASAIGNRYGFTGQVLDSHTGDYHFYYRDYSPASGTFNQRDLIGYKDGMALYQYTGNNPANGIDVWGLKKEDCPENEIIYITNRQWDLEVNKMRNELMKSHEKMISPFADAKSFDSRYHNEGERLFNDPGFDDRTQLYSFRGETYTGSELNYYFQGMFMGSFGYGETATAGIIKAWKSGAHGDHAPSPKIFEMAELGAAETPYDAATGLFLGSRAWDPGDLYRSDEHTDYRDPRGLPPLPRDNEGKGYYRYVLDKDGNIQVKFFDKRKMLEEQRRRRKLKIKCPEPGGSNKPRPPGRPSAAESTEYRNSQDPNEIIGPNGQPDVKWVSVNDRMPYIITCENDKSATAPARYIYISSPVEPKQDISTLEFGSFGLNNQEFDIPAGVFSYYKRLDCRDSMSLYVDVVAGFDPVKNEIFWQFQGIDPITLLPSEDPEKGILFMQDSTRPNYGHGFVTFSIRPRSESLTRDTIGARANIVFDQNDTIPTNIYTNTIDAFAPTSHMTAVTGTGTNPITLSWTGIDDAGGCGIDFYTVYVSRDEVNYSVLFPRMTRTDTTFFLPPDTNYCFFVLATDRVGNPETLRPGEIQCASIGGPLPVTWLYFTGQNQGTDNILKWGTASETSSKEFVLERSLDGINFTGITVLPAAGNSSVPRDYLYIDTRIDKLNSVIMYYRVKQVDDNGIFRYSNIVKLFYVSSNNVRSLLYPNPGRAFVSLLVGDAMLVGTEAIVSDVNGRILQRVKITATNQSFNLTTYVNGIYFIRLANGETLKFLKQ